LVRDCIADEISKQLKLSNWRFDRRPTPWHSTASGYRDK
jgi:hypothetical protein